MNYYDIKNMSLPTRKMYNVKEGDRVLCVGTATRNEWATTIDIDPLAPADIVADGCMMPFRNKIFDLVVLDYVTNFVKPKLVNRLIAEANRCGKRVAGRCHLGVGTLRGSKQRFRHHSAPRGVEWIR